MKKKFYEIVVEGRDRDNYSVSHHTFMFFLDKAKAQEICDMENQKMIKKAEQVHAAECEEIKKKQKERDVLAAAGLKAPYKYPEPRKILPRYGWEGWHGIEEHEFEDGEEVPV